MPSYFRNTGEDQLFEGNAFKPFKHRSLRLFFKGGDTSIDDTADQKALADIMADRHDRYKQTFAPIEDQYMERIDNFDSAERQGAVAGIAAGNTESEFADVVKQDIDNIAASGVNLGSGVAIGHANNRAIEKATARATNVNQSQQALQDSKVTGYQNIVAIGNNQSTQAINGMSTIASESQNKAIGDAQSQAGSDAATAGAIGSTVGLAYSGYKDSQEDANG